MFAKPAAVLLVPAPEPSAACRACRSLFSLQMSGGCTRKIRSACPMMGRSGTRFQLRPGMAAGSPGSGAPVAAHGRKRFARTRQFAQHRLSATRLPASFAMADASRPASAYCWAMSPWSWKRSGRVMCRTASDERSKSLLLSRWLTCAPKPAIAPSSTVTSAAWLRRQLLHKAFVEWLGEPRVGNGAADALLFEQIGRAQRVGQARAKAQDGNIVAFAQDAAFADFEDFRHRGKGNTGPFATGIAERDRAFVVSGRRRRHVHQFGFVGRCHDHHAGQGSPDKRDRSSPAWVAPSAPTKASTIDGEANGQTLNGDVMHHLVIGALQEGRIDRAIRLVAFGCQPGGERHGMLLRNADIEHAVRKAFGELVETGAGRHRRRDRDESVCRAPPAGSGLRRTHWCSSARRPWISPVHRLSHRIC